MTSQEVMSAVLEAAHRLVTVRIEIKDEARFEVHEVEPYSVIGRTSPQFYFWDVDSRQPTGVALDCLTSALPTENTFVPRYAMEL